MTAESVTAWLAEHAPELTVIDNGESCATVAEAAAAIGVEPARIAKTLAVRFGDKVVLVVASGEARLDNGKCRAVFATKPRMLPAEETEALTGHPVGGVCPFGLATPLAIWCDISIQAFATVFPAAGSRTTSVEVAPDRLCTVVGGEWADLCRLPD